MFSRMLYYTWCIIVARIYGSIHKVYLMKIKYVTLTGADDRTDANKMAELSKNFPFVEWGILFSSKTGLRYPSIKWVEESLPILAETNTSAHLCSKWVTEANTGNLSFLEHDISNGFKRIQLNFGASNLQKVLNPSSKIWNCKFDRPIIFGGAYRDSLLPISLFQLHNVHPLFDCSGGRGILATEWTEIITPLFCGYAGGLGPDNIIDELKKIEDIVGDTEIWIDMESSVRNDKNEFDLEKCEEVLSKILME